MGTKSILVVDDDAVVLGLVAHILGKCGYRVIAARGPDEALAAFRREWRDVALVVCDVKMPGMNGPELAGRLAAENPALRFLFISGYSDEESCGRIAAQGFPLLLKPFSNRALTAAVQKLLE
jgi:two-component system, cell cycle sensor histidine kinase and response regulator CckA